MLVTKKREKVFNVEMTARQREALILGLVALMENDAQAHHHFQAVELNDEQKEAVEDLRVSLLNAAT